MIDTGELANASELARSLILEVGWVCEVLRMTRLAPDIIRAILEGRQPRHLNLHAMRGRQGEVPLDWDGQRGMFGFAGDSGRSANAARRGPQCATFRVATALLLIPDFE